MRTLAGGAWDCDAAALDEAIASDPPPGVPKRRRKRRLATAIKTLVVAAFSSLMIAAPAGAQVNGYHRNQSAVTSLKSNGYRGNHSVITGWYGFYGSQYAVTFGQGYYVRVYRVAASEIDHLLYQRFISQGHNGHGASVLTLRWLRENLDLNLPASIAANVFGFWSFFTDSEWGDFQEALRNTVVNDACLLLHAEPGVPFVDQYNWTWALSDCNYGRPFIPS